MKTSVLKKLIKETKDGEWGKGEPFENSIKMHAIRGTDFDKVRTGDISTIPIRYLKKHIAERKTLQPFDIILETAGGSKNRPTGRSIFLRKSLFERLQNPLTCASFSRFIRIDPKKADPGYVYWYLQYLYRNRFLLKYHTQHTGVSRFQFTIFSEGEPIRLLSMENQRRINALLSAYDQLIEINVQKIVTLQIMAQDLYNEWVFNFRYSGQEDIDDIEPQSGLLPTGWEYIKMNDVISNNIGGDWGKETPEDDYKYPVYIIRGTDFNDLKLGNKLRTPLRYVKKSSHLKRKLKPGDIIVENSVNANTRCTGNTLLITKNLLNRFDTDVICASFCKLYRPIKLELSILAYHFMQGLYDSGKMKYYQNIATNGIGNFQSKLFLSNEKMLLPYEKIRQLLSKILWLLEPSLYALKIQILRGKFDLLLPILLSGKIDVSNLDIKNPGD